MNQYFSTFSKFADFSGRASFNEFWLFWTVNVVLGAAFGAFAGYSTVAFEVFVLLTILPTLALGVRRLHDIDKGIRWILIGVIPLGGLVLLVLFAQQGNPRPNRFGDCPRYKLA